MSVHSSATLLTPVTGEQDLLLSLSRVSHRSGLPDLGERLSALRAWIGDDLDDLDRAMATAHQGHQGRNGSRSGAAADAHLAERAAGYLLGKPGKRLRPLCVMLGARLGGRGFDRAVRDLAIACEVVHVATLLHDDVIDEGEQRRGQPAARMVFGNAASVLAGDHLLINALRLVSGTGYVDLLSGLFDTIAEMVAAEAVQLERRGRIEADPAAYFRIIDGKTAALFRWGLRAGGRAGGLDEADQERLARAGRAFGVAFQLTDDALDFADEAMVTGKLPLADLREGKLTWPLLVACERVPGFSERLSRAISGACTDGEIVGELVEAVRGCEALEATRLLAAEHAEQAEQELAALQPSPAREALRGVMAAAVQRQS